MEVDEALVGEELAESARRGAGRENKDQSTRYLINTFWRE